MNMTELALTAKTLFLIVCGTSCNRYFAFLYLKDYLILFSKDFLLTNESHLYTQ